MRSPQIWPAFSFPKAVKLLTASVVASWLAVNTGIPASSASSITPLERLVVGERDDAVVLLVDHLAHLGICVAASSSWMNVSS